MQPNQDRIELFRALEVQEVEERAQHVFDPFSFGGSSTS